jgi:glucose-1-phosphate thymidylyltransferase
LEITDLNQIYLQRNTLMVEVMGRGMTWLDAGTPESLQEASLFVQVIERRQGTKVACPEEIAFRMGFISGDDLSQLAGSLSGPYGEYLRDLLRDDA